jgi:hypothetical protein
MPAGEDVLDHTRAPLAKTTWPFCSSAARKERRMLRSSIRRLRWALIASAVVSLAFLTTTALGGSGVGANFNLGQTNTVNGTSILTGTTPGAQLRVNNASTAGGAFSVLGFLTPTSPGIGSAAVRGLNSGTGANGYGVWGSQAGGGIGVYGTAINGAGVGVEGVHASSGTGSGVYGKSGALAGAGVLGENTAGGPGLQSTVTSNAVPPLKVNSTALVANLNSSLLGGHASSYFLPTTGTAANSSKLGGLIPAKFWQLGGNAPGATGILGTTDNNPLELRVNGARALRIEPDATSPNLIGGSAANGNTSGSGAYGLTIAGGGDQFDANVASDNYDTVGGGFANLAGDLGADPGSAEQATVGGGAGNIASALSATVGGGDNNTASAQRSTVAGGDNNLASGFESAIAGGGGNMSSGSQSFVGGGFQNTASGHFSFAAGRQAKATQDGSFVWGDATAADVTSPVANSFTVRASGGSFFRGSVNVASGALSTALSSPADGATTPNVSNGNVFTVANSSPTTITSFIGGATGQTITLIFLDANTTVHSDGSLIFLQGGNDFVSSANDTLTLVSPSGGKWYEVSRSVN